MLPRHCPARCLHSKTSGEESSATRDSERYQGNHSIPRLEKYVDPAQKTVYQLSPFIKQLSRFMGQQDCGTVNRKRRQMSHPTKPAMLVDLLDDYSRQRVPAGEGRGYLKLTLVFLGICIAIPSFLLGSALVSGLGLRRAAAAIVLGTLISAPICVAAAHVGARARI